MPNSQTFPETAVAIVGMAGRFPDAPDLSTFWRNLTNGVESLAPVSDEELRKIGIPPALIADPNYVKKCTYLEGADTFDAAFFGFNAREAEILDPQQRVFLECAWSAIEDAGYVCDRYPGAVSVFAGESINTYLLANLLANPAVLDTVGGYQAMIASDKDFLATRVSYKLNLRGPSMTVQTACSTSLVAVQMAWQSLLDGQSDLALAGGVSIAFPQKMGYLYREGMIFSPDGHCRPFDEKGQGIRASAGAGVVALKRLRDAVADGDHIYAVILGAAINNDGAGKMGYTAPSIDGQAEVITMAQQRGGVDPDTITYVEAHGTATPLGDPIEVSALSQVFGARTQRKGFCAIGSLKSNLGHLDAAAGVAGLIKTALSLENHMLPPSINFERPNPQIDFANSPFYVNNTLSDWATTNGAPRRAGVSSFGIGGTNAHVVLQEAPPRKASEVGRPAQLLVLSARSTAALEAASSRLAEHLASNLDISAADAAYTLQVGRKRFEHRRAVVCRDRTDAITALGRRDTGKSLGRTEASNTTSAPSVAFLFSGQGSQYAGMGHELYESEPTFREELDRCAELLLPHLGRDIRTLMFETLDARGSDVESELNQTRFAQPALFAFEYALARTWMAWGIRPAAMLGHSIGEYVAACLSGVLSLEDGLRLVAERGRLMQEMPAGRMIAVPLSEEEVTPLIGGELSLAAVNAPRLCVVAGPADAIATLERQLATQGIECRALHTSHAFHSAMMEPALPSFIEALNGLTLGTPAIPYVSNLTGTWVTPAETTQPTYWAKHLRGTVRFADGLRELARIPGMVLLEVGPGKTLATLSRQTLGPSGHEALYSIPHPLDDQSDFSVILNTVGRLWVAGADIQWDQLHRGERLHRVSLPSYPFERQRYFVEPQPAAVQAQTASAAQQGAFSGRKSDMADWFLVPSWKRVPNALESGFGIPESDGSAWLIFLDPCGVGERMAARLDALGHTCLTIRPGSSYATGDKQYTIRVNEPDDYTRMLSDLLARQLRPRHWVHLWSVTDSKQEPSLNVALDYGFFSLANLAQTLGHSDFHEELALTVVSNGLQQVVGHEKISSVKSPVLGPVRVIPSELPAVHCQNIDIDLADVSDELIDALIGDAAEFGQSDIAAYRGGHRWIETFDTMRIGPRDGASSRLRQHGVYLITGGLGALGLAFAKFLATRVQAKLVLVGRSALPSRKEWQQWLSSHDTEDTVSQRIRSVLELEELGSEVLVAQADVSSREDMARVAEQTRRQFGSVNGIFHAAGTAGGAMIQTHSRSDALDVLGPKVHGTLILESLFQGPDLDLMVLFSSVNALMGYPGSLDYTAANIFLDRYAAAHAAARRAQGRNGSRTKVLSIDWDKWQEAGMAVATAALDPRNSAENGIKTVEGIEAFCRVIDSPLPQVAIIARNHITNQAPAAQTASAGETTPVSAPALSQHTRPELDQDFVAPQTEHEQFIAGLWQELLGIDRVGVDDNFFDLGGHSLIATGMLARIQKEYQVKLPLRTIFEASTVRELAERVSALVWAMQPATAPAGEESREQFEL